jgi:hypothetical protein
VLKLAIPSQFAGKDCVAIGSDLRFGVQLQVMQALFFKNFILMKYSTIGCMWCHGLPFDPWHFCALSGMRNLTDFFQTSVTFRP